MARITPIGRSHGRFEVAAYTLRIAASAIRTGRGTANPMVAG